MLALTRDEFNSRIKLLELKMDSKFALMDSRFSKIDSRFSNLESIASGMAAEVSRIAVLMEEQRSENRVVLEGYGLLKQRIDRVEKRVDVIETRPRHSRSAIK